MLRIRFRNEVGWSAYSGEWQEADLLMEVVPHVPAVAPARVDASTLGTQIGVQITALTGTATGGSAVLSYHIEYDLLGGGTGPWTEVVGATTDSLDLIVVQAGLTAGEMYYFRYRSKNVHGWSEGYSPVRAILLATVPD